MPTRIEHMSPKRQRVLFMRMCMALVTVAAVGGVLAFFAEQPNAVPDLLRPYMGWVIPLVALFVVIGVSWLLVSVRDDGQGRAADDVACEQCGAQLDRGWRMCPYCGATPIRAAIKPEGSPEDGVSSIL